MESEGRTGGRTRGRRRRKMRWKKETMGTKVISFCIQTHSVFPLSSFSEARESLFSFIQSILCMNLSLWMTFSSFHENSSNWREQWPRTWMGWEREEYTWISRALIKNLSTASIEWPWSLFEATSVESWLNWMMILVRAPRVEQKGMSSSHSNDFKGNFYFDTRYCLQLKRRKYEIYSRLRIRCPDSQERQTKKNVTYESDPQTKQFWGTVNDTVVDFLNSWCNNMYTRRDPRRVAYIRLPSRIVDQLIYLERCSWHQNFCSFFCQRWKWPEVFPSLSISVA